jgi:MYXO-CTERM domain-containing protein
MRTQTFISSMVGVAAAVAVAGSAMGAVTSIIIDPFTTATTVAQANNGDEISPIGGAFAVRYMTTNSGGISASVGATSGKMVGTWASNSTGDGQTLSAQWYNNMGDPSTNLSGFSQFDFFVGGSNIAGMTFTMEIAGGNSWDYFTASTNLVAGWNTIQLSDFNIPAYDGVGPINTSGVDLVALNILGDKGRNVEISNFTAAVPAPGAAALIGLAGLVASRRRRN